MMKRLQAPLRALAIALVAACFGGVLLTGCGNPGSTGSGSGSGGTTTNGVVFSTTSLPAGIANQAYSTTLAAKNGTAPYTFSISQGLLPTGFVMFTNGTISGTPTASGTYTFTALVSDANKQTATASFTLTINPPLSVSNTSLPAGEQGMPYSAQITGSSGTAPYTYAITTGTLPAGLSFSASGLISGTPTVFGSFPLTVQVTDSVGATAGAGLTLTIASAQLLLNTTGLPLAIENKAYSVTLGITGGLAPYKVVTTGTLPTGVTVSTAGVVSGTPTVEGSFPLNFTITDSAATMQTATGSLTLTVGTAATVNVNASTVLATLPATSYGIHTGVYDPLLNDASAMAPLFQTAGIAVMRYPGGSYSDSYHWAQWSSTPIYASANPACGVLFNAYLAPGSNFGNFAQTVQNMNQQALITVNYGTSVANATATVSKDQQGNLTCSEPDTFGQPQEAAAWVAYANGDPASTQVIGLDGVGFDWKTVGFWASLRAAAPLTKDDGYNFLRINHPTSLAVKNWEVGNEMYYNGWDGNRNFEDDLHAPYTYPGGYTSGTYNSRANLNALSPTAYGANAVPFIQAMKAVDPTIKIGVDLSSPGVDPIDTTWNPNVLQAVCGSANIDIAIIHYYPGTYQDVQASEMLSLPQADLPRLSTLLQQQLAQYCPANAKNVQLFITEAGENGTIDPKVPTQVVGLYALNTMLSGLGAGFSNLEWLELHDGGTFLDTKENPGPAFYGIEMAHSAFAPGDKVVGSTSSAANVVAYAGVKADGRKSLILINADPNAPSQVTVSFSGTMLGSTATQISYGVGTTPSSPVLLGTSTSIAGNTFVVTVPAYTAVELLIP